MKTRKIGKTELEVTEISFGAPPLGGLYRACPREQAMETLEAAHGTAASAISTSRRGTAWALPNAASATSCATSRRTEWVLSTKVGRLLRPVPTGTVPDYSYVDPLSFDADYDYSYDGIMRSVEFSYARLGLNRIDILYVHDIGGYTHGAAKNAVYLKQFLDSGIKALEELKSSGAIKAFGLGVNEVPVCLDVMRNADIDCILMAGRYTLLDRSAVAELLPLCRQKGTSLVVGGVFNSGILATGPVPGSHFDYMPATEDVLAKVRGMEKIAPSEWRAAGRPCPAVSAARSARRPPC